MASKLVFFHIMSATLLAVQLKADGLLPVIHVINAVSVSNSPPINVQVKAGGSLKGSAQLKPSQSFAINVSVKDVYYASALFGLKFTAFPAYEPAQDAGRAAIYWKADNDGFGISYDNVKYDKVAPWESE